MGFTIHLGGVAHDVEILARRPHLRLRIDDREYEVTSFGEEGDGRQTIALGSAELIRKLGRDLVAVSGCNRRLVFRLLCRCCSYRFSVLALSHQCIVSGYLVEESLLFCDLADNRFVARMGF